MKKEMKFEEAIARLEEIVKQLEGGSVPLDTSLALFEEGVTLAKTCNELLQNAQQKVNALVGGEEVPFEQKEQQ